VLSDDGHGGTTLVDPPAPTVTVGSYDTVHPAPDTLVVAAGPGSKVIAAPGDTVTGGNGVVVDFSELNRSTGGAVLQHRGTPINDTVVGFTGGVDRLDLGASGSQVVATAVVTRNGNTIVTLADHSSITFIGVTHANIGFFLG
jgi:hypothetical protein